MSTPLNGGETAGALDAVAIRVTVNHIGERGSKVYHLPLGGGRINEMDDHRLVVEVEPAVEMPKGQWRDTHSLRILATQVEKNGGYIRAGDTIHVGDEILVGRDMVDLLEELNRRANRRAEGPSEQYRQGYEDGVREVKAIVAEKLEALR